MPLEPRPTPAETCQRRVEATCGSSRGDGFRPLPGTVPFDVYLEGSNRIARESDTFSLSRAAKESTRGESAHAEPKGADKPAPTTPKNGWAKLGEVLTAWHGSKSPPPPAEPSAAPPTQTTAVRHTGTGRMIDVVT